jgi:hypothetical protein
MRLRLSSWPVRLALLLAVVASVVLAMSPAVMVAVRQAARATPRADWTCPMHPTCISRIQAIVRYAA